jgi:hypothetical protein
VAESTNEQILRDMVECKDMIIKQKDEALAGMFTAKEVASAVKAAFVFGVAQNACDFDQQHFDPAALARITALAGLSQAQGKALYDQLV